MLSSELRKGSAEVLVLGVLQERTRHGYEIARIIEDRSAGEIVFHSATLYPTLYRLERKGLIKGRWVEKAGQRRRRFYRITPRGRAVLGEQRTAWNRFFAALHRVVQTRER
jgi:PadR family transcriptional regulator, regulatory protein PadR